MGEAVFEAETSPLSRLRQPFPSNQRDLFVGFVIRETPEKVLKESIDVSGGFHIHHVVNRNRLQHMLDQLGPPCEGK